MAEEDHAVVVGIRTYPAIRPLKGPCRDALAFKEWLRDEDGGNVPEDNIQSRTTDDYPDPETTTRPNTADLHELFFDFLEHGASNDTPLGNRLYIYLAGHGFSERQDLTKGVALYAAEARPAVAANLAATTYALWLRRRAVFKEIVLVADCCRTTSPTHNITPPPLPNVSPSPGQNKVRTFFAYAVPDGQPARERATNGTWRGIFTMAFLDALKKAPPNEAGEVRGKQIANYLRNTVSQEQEPDFMVDQWEDVTFSMNRPPGLIATSIRLDPFEVGLVVRLFTPEGDEVLQTIAAEPTISVDLVPGFYRVFVDGTDRSDLFQVPIDEPTI